MVAAFLILRGGENGPPPEDSFLVSIPDMTVMLPDGVYILVVGITLEISPLKERGFNKTDAKQELAAWSEDTADTTRMPLVRETIGMVLASKTKEEWTMEIVKNQIKTKIMNELNSKVLKKCRVRQVIFSTPPLIQ
jgi:flagellar basal body-associated protein FliL